MAKSLARIFSCLLILSTATSSVEVKRPHFGFLIRAKEYTKAIDGYVEYMQTKGSHDFETLQEMAITILQQGAKSRDAEEQLLSIFGASIAHIPLPSSFLYEAIVSENPYTQIACLHLIQNLQDDRFDEIINKAMSSAYFVTRIEAAHVLAQRKTKNASGQIESLMHRIPNQMHFLFADFFAEIGTTEAIGALKHLMNDPLHQNRIAAILSAAAYGRDDLLNGIRAKSTQLNAAQQEACASALGMLKDHQSIKKLQNLSNSQSDNVKLAALRSLFALGQQSVKESIEQMAKEGNLFAIHILGDIEGSDDTLLPMLTSENPNIKFNATISLLRRQNPACLKSLISYLLRDNRDTGFLPLYSQGSSLPALKVIASASAHQEVDGYNIAGYSLFIRERLLKECLELKEDRFLSVVATIFNSKQKELVPLCIELLIQKNTPNTIAFLKHYAQMHGAPLTRGYCTLALVRLNQEEEYVDIIRSLVRAQKGEEIIRFKPPASGKDNPLIHNFELSPEENSTLLVNSCLTLANRHDKDSIDILLQLIKDGNPKNRALLAAILLNALQ